MTKYYKVSFELRFSDAWTIKDIEEYVKDLVRPVKDLKVKEINNANKQNSKNSIRKRS